MTTLRHIFSAAVVLSALIAAVPHGHAQQASTGGDVTSSQSRYTEIRLDPSKADSDALAYARVLAKDYVEENSAIGAQFIDTPLLPPRSLLAVYVSDEYSCGAMGCVTLIFQRTDAAKNTWTTAWNNLTNRLWLVTDDAGAVRIVMQGQATTSPSLWQLSNGQFAEIRAPARTAP